MRFPYKYVIRIGAAGRNYFFTHNLAPRYKGSQESVFPLRIANYRKCVQIMADADFFASYAHARQYLKAFLELVASL